MARCFWIVDLGTQKTPRGESRKVFINFELPNTRHVFNDEKGEEPFSISTEMFVSMFGGPGKKTAAFREFLESWRGKKYTQQEVENGIDLTKMVGAPCKVRVIHNETANGTYANIQYIFPLDKGDKCPEAVNPTRCVVLDTEDPSNFNKRDFEHLPEFLQKKIELSPEYKYLNDIGVIYGTWKAPDKSEERKAYEANKAEREAFEASEKARSKPAILEMAAKDLDWNTTDPDDGIPGLESDDPPF